MDGGYATGAPAGPAEGGEGRTVPDDQHTRDSHALTVRLIARGQAVARQHHREMLPVSRCRGFTRSALDDLRRWAFPRSVSRLILLGIGTERSPRFAPAGLLLEYGHVRVGIDGGPGSEPAETIDAWLVSREHGPLAAELRTIARQSGMPEPAVMSYDHGPLAIEPLSLADGLYGYRVAVGHHLACWAPEAAELPPWAAGMSLVFADGSPGWPDIRRLAEAAERLRVQRLVFVRLGTAALAALDAGERPPYGEWGEEGRAYRM